MRVFAGKQNNALQISVSGQLRVLLVEHRRTADCGCDYLRITNNEFNFDGKSSKKHVGGKKANIENNDQTLPLGNICFLFIFSGRSISH